MPRRPHVTVRSAGPFDLALSLAAAASFAPVVPESPSVLSAVLRIGATSALVECRQISLRPPIVAVLADGPLDRAGLKNAAAWLLAAELDLRPFYRLVADHPVFGTLTKSLRGLKPLRPSSLFEMAVIAITEQQISLAAAYRIRQRLIERFGTPKGKLWIFPSPEALAKASKRALLACGLSHRKAEYIGDLARDVAAGKLDLDSLRAMSDDEARAFICAQRGFGAWSADYILVRGLGRLDCIPIDDLGVRDAVGKYLGRGKRVSPRSVERLLRPFAPYRGLAIFYLLADDRLNRRIRAA